MAFTVWSWMQHPAGTIRPSAGRTGRRRRAGPAEMWLQRRKNSIRKKVISIHWSTIDGVFSIHLNSTANLKFKMYVYICNTFWQRNSKRLEDDKNEPIWPHVALQRPAALGVIQPVYTTDTMVLRTSWSMKCLMNSSPVLLVKCLTWSAGFLTVKVPSSSSIDHQRATRNNCGEVWYICAWGEITEKWMGSHLGTNCINLNPKEETES